MAQLGLATGQGIVRSELSIGVSLNQLSLPICGFKLSFYKLPNVVVTAEVSIDGQPLFINLFELRVMLL